LTTRAAASASYHARPSDKTGASTSNLLAALLIEPITAGTGAFSVSGSATIPAARRLRTAVPPGGDHGALMARGFSFVELLVVTTIVLILIGRQPLAK
jgi:prepilin-type N-terminal cleavage/methylation domain-containing protein